MVAAIPERLTSDLRSASRYGVAARRWVARVCAEAVSRQPGDAGLETDGQREPFELAAG